jgi:hypothetical protein
LDQLMNKGNEKSKDKNKVSLLKTVDFDSKD